MRARGAFLGYHSMRSLTKTHPRIIAVEPSVFKAEPSFRLKLACTLSLTNLRIWVLRHPVLTVLFVSTIAVVINCYPIVFFGKSYVSPASVRSLLYDRWPPISTLGPKDSFAPQHGSDVGAMMWWDVPIGFLQSRCFWEYHELPLWNRYSHAGAPLIGQAVSMLGDPLQMIVIFGHGSALAWDLKFLAAKILFCFGFGLLIRLLLGSVPIALIFAALAAYCGAYFFIASHPVFFVLAYAPWILLSAIHLLKIQSKPPFGWAIIWLLANVGCFNGGHVEVAVDLIAGLNVAAFVEALLRQHSTTERFAVLCRLITATLLFLGFTAPVWTSFLVNLQGAYTIHNEVKVVQQSLESLPGAFDDEFFRGVSYLCPGTSLLVMVGVILSALNWRQFRNQIFFWVNSSAVLVWGGCVFGWIPGSVLACIPLWNRVGHLATDISYLLIIHLTIQCAYGFRSLNGVGSFRKVTTQFLWILLIFCIVMLKYSFLLTSLPARWYYFLWAGIAGIGAPLLYCYLKDQYSSISTFSWLGILILGFVSQHRFGLYTFGDKSALMVPGPRVRLDPPNQPIERLKAQNQDPFRVVSLHLGYEGALSGDYSAVYSLEDMRSCAPVADGEYIKLLQNFPGLDLNHGWVICVTNPVLAHPLLNLLNVKYLLASQWDAAPETADFPMIDQSDFLVLQNPQVWPRAFLVNKVSTANSTQEFIHRLLGSTKPFVAMTSSEITRLRLTDLEATASPSITAATEYQLLPSSTAFRLHANTPGVVCLTESQAKDFKVTVNGEPKEVLTLNRIFKGVYLTSPGDYQIVFTYRPRYWTYACSAFAVSLLLTLAVGIKALAQTSQKFSPCFNEQHNT
jgi:hypothetical protein